MRDNSNNQIRLVIGDIEINGWDNVTVDSQIDTPADNWNLSLFRQDGQQLPDSVHGGAKIQLFYNDEVILSSIADRVTEAVNRDGYGLEISGRDLVGQLIDCSVPIFNGRQVTLEELLQRYVLAGDLGSVIHDVRIQNNSWLKNKVSVEPSESLWDAIAKAAQVTGQHVWLEPDGSLSIGDPFANPYQVKESLRLMKPLDNQNNVLDLQYDNDVSDVFSDIKILSQSADAQSILSEITTQTQYSFKRLKIVTLGDVETKAEADAALIKIKKDNDLQAHSLTATVDDWVIDGRLWRAGWYVNLETNALSHATAKWAVLGRTFYLSRDKGKTTKLNLKRQGDWAQPLIHKEKQLQKKKKKSQKTNGDQQQ
nr:MAG TPA: 43 kDa tail protein [Caudoviricetes sp.]